ncbi:outer membrane protein transport protein [Bacteroidales bacterium OttesenSCG-928-B11]|nr:outer membrane protein transport protein [Bacteroidales bacterium OttesenSCG-928-E04]MDL2312841.1 outer membrane protein transport protein [Bacteroidales bacterium OttesenSCG-928-B11]
MKKFLISTIILCLATVAVKAQSDVDAFRFSQTNWQGTARFMGAGGAFGAVGAEYSALSINPASIGIYKKSEFSFTPVVISFFNTSSDYNGKTSNYLSTNYSLTNFGMVLTAPIRNESAWKGMQFGFGYNRINDFNNGFRVEGVDNSSIANYYVDMANGTYYGNLSDDVGLAFDTWVIDTANSPYSYYPLSNSNEVNQKKSVLTSGGIDEMNLTLGGNYDDKLYIGATIGIPFLKYRESVTFQEDNLDENPQDLTQIKHRSKLDVNGTGINLKLGLIYQPVDFFRIGAAFHTPTYYSLREDYISEMETNLSAAFKYENEYKYKLTTPLRVNANIAFLIKGRAFISADYEFTNYGMAKMYASDYGFYDENANISKKYGASHVIRIGGEVYLTKHFLCRLGYNFQSNPYKDNINNTSSHLAAIGVGYRSSSFFVDFAYNLKLSKEDHWMYSPEYAYRAENSYNTNRFAVTVGYKF